MRSSRIAMLACLLPVLGGALASHEPVQENDMKAAFVFNFAVFTVWPDGVLPGSAPISVCAGAANPMMASLLQLNDKLVNGHPIAVRASGASVRGCHVLVLDRHDRLRWPQLKRELAGATVLTVSDDRSISTAGAVIGMSVEDQRIGFDVDIAAARSARLNLSSKLLRLARSVQ
jgi:hypothetical protein